MSSEYIPATCGANIFIGQDRAARAGAGAGTSFDTFNSTSPELYPASNEFPPPPVAGYGDAGYGPPAARGPAPYNPAEYGPSQGTTLPEDHPYNEPPVMGDPYAHHVEQERTDYSEGNPRDTGYPPGPEHKDDGYRPGPQNVSELGYGTRGEPGMSRNHKAADIVH